MDSGSMDAMASTTHRDDSHYRQRPKRAGKYERAGSLQRQQQRDEERFVADLREEYQKKRRHKALSQRGIPNQA